MKTLLIPTDFNLRSLEYIPNLVKKFQGEQLNIILVHMMKITDSLPELLMLSRRSAEYQHISDDFYNACNRLKQQYSNEIACIRIEFFYGSTVAVFRNFVEAHTVDAIVCLDDYNYKLLNKNSIEPALLITRSKMPLVHVAPYVNTSTAAVVTEEILEMQEV